MRVSGLPHSEKIKYLNSEDATVAHVVSIREEAPTAAEVEAAAAAEAAAATAAAEPEVAKKGGKPEDAAAKRPELRSSQETRGKEVSLGRGKRVRCTASSPFIVVGLGNAGSSAGTDYLFAGVLAFGANFTTNPCTNQGESVGCIMSFTAPASGVIANSATPNGTLPEAGGQVELLSIFRRMSTCRRSTTRHAQLPEEPAAARFRRRNQDCNDNQILKRGFRLHQSASEARHQQNA